MSVIRDASEAYREFYNAANGNILAVGTSSMNASPAYNYDYEVAISVTFAGAPTGEMYVRGSFGRIPIPHGNSAGPHYRVISVQGHSNFNIDNYTNQSATISVEVHTRRGEIISTAGTVWVDKSSSLPLFLHGYASSSDSLPLLEIGFPGNCKSYYPLNETSGDRDDSISGYTLKDQASVLYDTGKLGNAAKFDGSNYLKTDGLNTPGFTNADGEITVSLWFYADASISGSLYIATSKYNLNDYAFLARFEKGETNRIRTYWRKSNATIINDLHTSLLSLETWYHYVFRVQKVDAVWKYSSFINGTEDVYTATGDYGFMPFGNNSVIAIGAYFSGASLFLGLVDEFAIFNAALSDDEIAALYNSGDGITR
jgi:hypothetical protein